MEGNSLGDTMALYSFQKKRRYECDLLTGKIGLDYEKNLFTHGSKLKWRSAGKDTHPETLQQIKN